MKWILNVLAVVSLVAPALSGAQVSTETARSVHEQLDPVLAEMLVAANAHDTDRFMAPYLREPSFVFAINGTIMKGWDAVHAQQLIWWNNGKSDVVYAYDKPAEFTVLDRDAAVVTQPISATRTTPDGKKVTGEIVATTVWQKFPEGWRGVQVHESTAPPPQH